MMKPAPAAAIITLLSLLVLGEAPAAAEAGRTRRAALLPARQHIIRKLLCGACGRPGCGPVASQWHLSVGLDPQWQLLFAQRQWALIL